MQNVTTALAPVAQPTGQVGLTVLQMLTAFGRSAILSLPGGATALQYLQHLPANATKLTALGDRIVQQISNSQTVVGKVIFGIQPPTTAVATTSTAMEIFQAGSTAFGMAAPFLSPVTELLMNLASTYMSQSSQQNQNNQLRDEINATAADAVDEREDLVEERVEALEKEKDRLNARADASWLTSGRALSFVLGSLSPLALLPQIGIPVAAGVIVGGVVASGAVHVFSKWYNRRAARNMDKLIAEAKQNIAIDKMYQQKLLTKDMAIEAVRQEEADKYEQRIQATKAEHQKMFDVAVNNRTECEEYYLTQIAELQTKISALEEELNPEFFDPTGDIEVAEETRSQADDSLYLSMPVATPPAAVEEGEEEDDNLSVTGDKDQEDYEEGGEDDAEQSIAPAVTPTVTPAVIPEDQPQSSRGYVATALNYLTAGYLFS